MKNIKLNVGTRVQHIKYNEKFIKDGIIESIVPPKKPRPKDYWKCSDEERKEFITFANVKWDDGSIEQLDIDYLEPEDSEIEREFRKIYWSTDESIQEKLEQANKLIKQAINISEQNGVPFRAYVSPITNSYFPSSRLKKFPDVSIDFINNITDTYNEDDTSGWRHSAIC